MDSQNKIWNRLLELHLTQGINLGLQAILLIAFIDTRSIFILGLFGLLSYGQINVYRNIQLNQRRYIKSNNKKN